jgi:hypothetical protein
MIAHERGLFHALFNPQGKIQAGRDPKAVANLPWRLRRAAISGCFSHSLQCADGGKISGADESTRIIGSSPRSDCTTLLFVEMQPPKAIPNKAVIIQSKRFMASSFQRGSRVPPELVARGQRAEGKEMKTGPLLLCV